MFIEIRGTDFVNKGAELMLRSIVAKLRQDLPGVKLVMAPPVSDVAYLKRCELGMYQKIWFHRYGVQWGNLGKMVPKKFKEFFGMVDDSEINVILDASGFAYGDQWGPNGTIAAAKAIVKWKNQGAKVIFMPQSFGPFTGKRIRNSFKKIIEHADLIFARDKVSYDHITSLAGQGNCLKMAPDFTNLMKGKSPGDFDKIANRFCIIPNCRMLDKTDEKTNYIPFLTNCTRYLLEKGAKPFILIHEGKGDLLIANEIRERLGQEINIVCKSDPLEIKGIIGSSDGVISSRYHGIVNALSQGVPALGTGWSHKYEALFHDYNFPEGMLRLSDPQEDVYNKIQLLLSDVERKVIKTSLSQYAATLRSETNLMWDTIFESLKSVRRGPE